MGDYVYPERRKNKNDKRAKRRVRVYKQGGTFRGTDIGDGKTSR